MKKENIEQMRNNETRRFLQRRGFLSHLKGLKRYEVLEIGSGEGRFERISGIKTTKLDIRKNSQIEVVGDAKELPFKKEKFKVVVAQLFLDLFDEDELFEIGDEIKRVLKKDGKLIVLGDEIPSLNGIIKELSNKLDEEEYAIPIIKEKRSREMLYTSFIEDIGFSVIKNIEKTAEKVNALIEILGILGYEELVIKNIKEDLNRFIDQTHLITYEIKRDDRDYVKILFRLHLKNNLNMIISKALEKGIINLNQKYKIYAGKEAKKRIKKIMQKEGFNLSFFSEEFLEFEFNNSYYGVPVYGMVFNKE